MPDATSMSEEEIAGLLAGISESEWSTIAEAAKADHDSADETKALIWVGLATKAGRKCKYCDNPATKRVSGGDGKAAVYTCAGHLPMAKRAMRKMGSMEVSAVKAAGSIDTDPDPSPKPGAARLRHYWTRGEGAAKVGWGKPGDFMRCVHHLTKYVGSEERAKGLCNVYHRAALGVAPGQEKFELDWNEEIRSKVDSILDDGDPETKDEDMRIEHKAVGVTGFKVLDEQQGIAEAFVSVTGLKDNVNDNILPGAYEKTLATRVPKGIYSHNWEQPVSKTLVVRELLPGDPMLPKQMKNGTPWPEGAGALYVKTQFNLDTQRGKEAFSDVKFFGDEQEWSIGYHVPVGGAKVDTKTGVREITTINLFEYSPVLFGAMPEAVTTSVKSAQTAYRALMESKEDDPGVEVVEEPAETPPLADDETDDEAELDEELDDEDEDGDEDKSGRVLSSVNLALVQRVIKDLEDLVSSATGDTTDEVAPTQTKDGGFSTYVKSMTRGMYFADDLVTASKEMDAALEGGDQVEIESTAGDFLDMVADEIGDASDGAKSALKEITQELVWLLQTAQEEKAAYGVSGDGKERFPINSRKDVENAVQAIGRAKPSEREKIKAYIASQAKKLGCMDAIPASWGTGGKSGRPMQETKQERQEEQVIVDLSGLAELQAFLGEHTE